MYKYQLILIPLLLSTLSACSNSDIVIELGSANACDVAVTSCSVSSEGYTLTLQLGPDVKPLRPFTTQLKVKGANGGEQGVVVDFQMVGMDMGLNRYRLRRRSDSWVGNTTLPVCTASRTDWNAVVEFIDAEKRYVASFPFHTDAK